MNVLLVGSGGREHALAWKLAQSAQLTTLFASPGSDAIAALADCVALADHEAMTAFCARESIALVVVGPEVPLVNGLADRLCRDGVPVFGHSQAAAKLEGSKAFSKAFMETHRIPTAAFHRFTNVAEAEGFARQAGLPWVVKADGLAAGKGVVVPASVEETVEAVHQVHAEFGGELVLEEKLEGEELSFFAVCDGTDHVLFPSAQDHKQIFDGDIGPNTGGMGAYCPAPLLGATMERQLIEEALRPTLQGMRTAGHPYVGVLYIGVMVTAQGPRVLEYNCRFGDPECQAQMLMLESDLLAMLYAAATGTLAAHQPVWRPGAAATVVLASEGYPGAYETGRPIHGLEQPPPSAERMVFHAGTRRQDAGWVTAGGRVLNVTCHAESLQGALDACYATADQIGWNGAHYRRDIGQKGLQRLRSG